MATPSSPAVRAVAVPPRAAAATPAGAGVPAAPSVPARPRARLATLAAWGVALALAVVQGTAWRNLHKPDGVSYLDMSDAVATGRSLFPSASAYWSPLYPWLVGVARRLLAPFGVADVQAAHAVSVACALVALAAFLRLLAHAARVAPLLRAGAGGWWLAVATFLWGTFRLVGVANVSPDPLVGAITLGMTALALPLATDAAAPRRATLARALAVGAVAGLGYLAKTAMLPIGLAALVAVAAAMRPWRRGVVAGVVMCASCLAVAAPQVVEVSRLAGRPSFGTTGALNYAWYVNGAFQSPVHRAPRLHVAPLVLDTDRGRPGTFPPWYDVTSWRPDVRPAFRPAQQRARLARNLGWYGRVAWPLLLLAATWVVLAGGASRGPASRAEAHEPPAVRAVRRRAASLVAAPVLAAGALYALVLVFGRYVGGTLALAPVAIVLAAAPRPRVGTGRALLLVVVAALATTLAAGTTAARDVALAVALALLVAAGATRRPPAVLAALVATWLAADPSVPPALAGAALVGVGALLWARDARHATLDGMRVATVACLVVAAPFVAEVVRTVGPDLRALRTPPAPDPIARGRALAAAGLHPGDRVASLRRGMVAYWARDARLRVVAELPDSAVATYHAADAATRARVDSALARHGVRALVAEGDPRATGPGWRAVPGSALAIHDVPPLR